MQPDQILISAPGLDRPLTLRIEPQSALLVGRNPSESKLSPALRAELGNRPVRCESIASARVSANHVLVLHTGEALRLWDLGTGAEQLRLSGHIAPVTACAFTGDGKSAVSAALDYTLKLWELHSGMCVETIYGSSAYRLRRLRTAPRAHADPDEAADDHPGDDHLPDLLARGAHLHTLARCAQRGALTCSRPGVTTSSAR